MRNTRSLKTLIRNVVERGLKALTRRDPKPSARPPPLPSIRLGRPLNLAHPSNAALFGLLDD
jgi:hypothetical protein